jgi:FixJ family two-component response regulator
LALVDLRLPNAAGTEVIASVRQASPRTRVVAMSAFPDTQQVLDAIRAGARDLIEKPIRQKTLYDAMDRQLADVGIAARSESEFNQRLGARLRQLRHESERTLQDVAAQSGITAAQLSQIETGKTATSTWTLARLCGALRVRMESFFGGM